jgi:hypothetical protein
MYREFTLTVKQCVDRFGEQCSAHIRHAYDRGDYQTPIDVVHAIEPNDSRKFDSPLSADMRFRSVYFEAGEGCQDGYLHLSGFREDPIMSPRWEVVGEDVYASSYPGIDSIGTNKSLQVEELDKATAIEKMHNPPLVGDAALSQSGMLDLIAGGVSYVPNMAAMGKPGLQSVYDVNMRIGDLKEDIMEKENRISRAFYEDLFLMVTEMDRAQITATEIAERKEEKLLMLGPVLESLNTELLDPVIDRTFSLAQRAGILPPPPSELDNMDLKVEYVSVLAQAQKAVATASMESTIGFAANAAAIWPEARHKIDIMQSIDEYARAKGAPPKVIKSDDDANAAIAAEQQQAQMAAMAEMANAATATAKTMSETDTEADNALTQLTGALAT